MSAISSSRQKRKRKQKLPFCGPMCQESYKADREHGLVYGPGWMACSLKEQTCAYCGRWVLPYRKNQG